MLLVYVEPRLFLFLSRLGTDSISWACSGTSIIKPSFLLPVKAWKILLFSWYIVCFPLSKRQQFTKVWIKLIHLFFGFMKIMKLIRNKSWKISLFFLPFLFLSSLKEGNESSAVFPPKQNQIPSLQLKNCVWLILMSQANLQMQTAIKVDFNSSRVEATEHLFSTRTVICIQWTSTYMSGATRWHKYI